jgi:hypothetical protein
MLIPMPKGPTRLVLEFERFQVLHESIRDLAHHKGVCVLDLFLRVERVVFPAVTAIGASDRRRAARCLCPVSP